MGVQPDMQVFSHFFTAAQAVVIGGAGQRIGGDLCRAKLRRMALNQHITV
ncbi:hypothetical protein SDC9_121741 [bioreactor metagenome]|uniref:Uncharacterized protein n=1 Tax=bioreactor metagenome TaxID=1076179 RepID=A0A645CD03_9ZZZZ